MAMTDMTQAMGILGKSGIVYESNKFILNQRIGRIRALPEVNVNFLVTSLNSPHQLNFLKERALGSVQKYVNPSHIKEMEFIMPTGSLMASFGNLIDPIFNMIRSNDLEIEHLSYLRDTLLPKLLSGEIELTSTEKDSVNA